MPSTGPHSFLRVDDMDEYDGKIVCQCPQPGHTHFYEDKFMKVKMYLYKCQCPQPGHTHFYGEIVIKEDKENMCQCPQPGHTHFYCPPLKNPYFIRLRGPHFCRLFTEYSEKGVFSGIYLYVHSLFIFKPVSKPSHEAFSPVYHTTF